MEHSNGYTARVKVSHTGRQPTVIRYAELKCSKCSGVYLLSVIQMPKGYARTSWTCPSCRGK